MPNRAVLSRARTALSTPRTALSTPRKSAMYAYPLGVLRNRPYAYYRTNELAGRGIVNLVTGKTVSNAYSATGVTYGVAGGFASDPSGAVTFDGASGSVTLPMPTAQAINVSLECRVRLLSANSHGYAMKVGATSTGYGMGIGGTGLTNLGTQFIAAGEDGTWHLSGVNLSILTWHYIVWTFASTNTSTFYVDGSQVAQFAGGTVNIPTTASYIGSDGAANYSNLSQSDCAFYNYVLSPAQVAAQALLSN